MMAGDIPMLETRFPVIVMGNASGHDDIKIDVGIPGNISNAFVLTGCKVEVLSSTPKETCCSGIFCNKQRIHKITENNQ